MSRKRKAESEDISLPVVDEQQQARCGDCQHWLLMDHKHQRGKCYGKDSPKWKQLVDIGDSCDNHKPRK